jgi:hypothetical protein
MDAWGSSLYFDPEYFYNQNFLERREYVINERLSQFDKYLFSDNPHYTLKELLLLSHLLTKDPNNFTELQKKIFETLFQSICEEKT